MDAYFFWFILIFGSSFANQSENCLELCKTVECPELKFCVGRKIEEPKPEECLCCPRCIFENSDSDVPSCLKLAILRKNKRNTPIKVYLVINQLEIDFPISISEDLWIPECENGRYKFKQCKSSKCMCVDRNGLKIFGQAEKVFAENMTCECSHELARIISENQIKWEASVHPHCSSDGNFSPLQCTENTCYCADVQNGEPVGRLAHISQMDHLPCYDKAKDLENYETLCEKEIRRISSMQYEFVQKGVNIELRKHPCDLDGSYKPKQCMSNECWCSSPIGLSLKSYKVEIGQLARMTDCGCALDEYLNTQHAHYPKFTCDQYGNYLSSNCQNEECFCVDPDGDVLTKPFSIKQFSQIPNFAEKVCDQVRMDLSNVQQ